MSLSEIIMALAILALAVLAGVGVQMFALKAQTKSGRWSQASLLAQSVMARTQEQLQTSFTSPVAVTRIAVPADLDPEGVFEYEVLEQPEPEPMADSLKRVDVFVYWQDQSGDQRFQLTTKVAAP